jgi:hypothetical protein
MRRIWDEEYTHADRTDKPVFLHAARHLTLSDNSLLYVNYRDLHATSPANYPHTQLSAFSILHLLWPVATVELKETPAHLD